LVVGFLGGLRLEKGAIHWPIIAEHVLAAVPTVRFVAQANLHHNLEELRSIVSKLQALAQQSSRIELILEPLDPDAFYHLFQTVDIVLLPYDPTEYAHRTSGISIEAMVAGRVIVGPDNGWIYERGRQYGGYVAVDTRHSQAMVEGTLLAIRDFDRLAEAAARDAQHFSDQSPAGVVSVLLDISRVAAP
jgi:hypothetical protein